MRKNLWTFYVFNQMLLIVLSVFLHYICSNSPIYAGYGPRSHLKVNIIQLISVHTVLQSFIYYSSVLFSITTYYFSILSATETIQISKRSALQGDLCYDFSSFQHIPVILYIFYLYKYLFIYFILFKILKCIMESLWESMV